MEYKGECDLVTATDKKCEDLIFELLQSKFPAHSFVGEESVAAVGAGACTLAVETLDDDSQYSRVRVTTLTPGSARQPLLAGRVAKIKTVDDNQYGPRTCNRTSASPGATWRPCGAADGVIPPIGDEPTWFVDPLDGTTNFVHGFPFSCVSIGLAGGGTSHP